MLCIAGVLFCGLGGGSSRTGTGVTFLYLRRDRTTYSPPNTFPHASQTLPSSPSTSPLHAGCPHLSRRQLSIISVSQNPAGAHCARGRRRRQALGGSGGRRWRVRCQSLSLIINFCHSAPWQPRSPALPPSLCGFSLPG